MTRSIRWTAMLLGALLGLAFPASAEASAVISQRLVSQLSSLADDAPVGLVIVSFDAPDGLQATQLGELSALGITRGFTLHQLGMVAAPLTAAQLRSVAALPDVRSVWDNRRLDYFEIQTNTVTGVERLRQDAALTGLNRGLPVTGRGITVVINDSGIDARHDDLKLGTHVVQNVQIVTDTSTLEGFTPLLAVENVPDTDLNVGHGTHCAGIVGGTGQDSGGLYAGVAPGANLIGTGSGAVLFVLNALGGFEWSLANQGLYGIRVISNSYGGTAPGFDPSDPVNIASKLAHDRNITVVFAAGNSGPGKGTLNPYAKAPWVIGVAAGTKEGGLASFSSRGLPAAERPASGYNEFPTLTAPGTGREFDPALSSISSKFTSDVVSTRSATNVFANGLTNDLELPPQYLPFYTEISGTSMATPFVAGAVALLLEANPSLSPDEVKQILIDTASHMPGYQDFEVGAGYLNVFAAVDQVFHPEKTYGSFREPVFNEQFTVQGPAPLAVHIDYNPLALPGPASSNARTFTVAPGMNLLDVFARFDNALETGDGNTIGILLTDPSGATYSSGIALPALDSNTREVTVKNPLAGGWLVEVRGVRGLAAAPNFSLPTSGAAAPGPVDLTLTQQQFVLAPVADIQGHPAQAEIELALQSRYMDTFPDGTFRPDRAVTRGDLSQLLFLNTALRQSLADSPRFTDLDGADEALAEAVSANGSTLRDYDFQPTGMIAADSLRFRPAAKASRLDIAVALVKALGLDPQAKALAGSTVTAQYLGQVIPLADNDQIPSALRGYVQLALDLDLLQASFALEQGPYDFVPTLKARFDPTGTASRALMAYSLDHFRAHFAQGY